MASFSPCRGHLNQLIIRAIFAGYLERGAVSALQRQMSDAGLHVPERIDGAGRRTGGKPFSRLPRGLGLKHLAELPPSWAEQPAAIGI